MHLHTLISEEMSMLLCQIEACLIAPVSDNLDDYHAPDHFLVGTFLIALAEPSMLDLNIDFRVGKWFK